MPEHCSEAPKLLVSVRNIHEAHEALAGGADIIDVKDPQRGSLGRADVAVLAAIARDARLATRVPLTCALGELTELEDLGPSLATSLDAGWRALKVGLAGEGQRADWRERARRVARAFAKCGPLVPVAYADAATADAPAVREVLALAIELAAPFLLVDTCHKNGKCLWDWLRDAEIAELAANCREAGIGLALAGSLTFESLPRLLSLQPAVVAVRGAACAGSDRTAAVDRERVRRLKSILAPA